MPQKHALIIGINYKNTMSELRGCINDANNIKQQLFKWGYRSFQVLTDETSKKPTRANILQALDQVIKLSQKGCKELFVHYSGHGSYQFSNKSQELDKQDEVLVPLDHERNGYISDDLIHQKLSKLNPKSRLTLVFDCCHSGSIADIQYRTLEPGKFVLENNQSLPANIVMYSGCKDSQTSADAFNIDNQRKWSGAMTTAFLKAVAGQSRQGCFKTLAKMRQFISERGYSQVPQLSSSRHFNKDIDLLGGLLDLKLDKPAEVLRNQRKLARQRKRKAARLRKRKQREQRQRTQRKRKLAAAMKKKRARRQQLRPARTL